MQNKEDFEALIVELLGMGYDAEEARKMADEILENEACD